MVTLLKDLLVDIEQGLYALPEIQRPYVWRNPQVRQLFESIYNNYPIGAIIVWEPAREVFEHYSDLFRPLSRELEDVQNNFKYLVIDGQQRMLSIWLVSRGSITIKDDYGERKREIGLYYNADKDELFVSRARSKYEKDPSVYEVKDLLVKDIDIEDLLDEKDVEDKTKRKLIRSRLTRFRDSVLNYPVDIYLIPSSTLRYERSSDSDNFLELFEKISHMFVRLNYTGTRVRAPHLILALLTSKTRRERGESFRRKISYIVDELKNLGWILGEGTIMRSFLSISLDEPRFRRAQPRLSNMSAEDALKYLDELEYVLKYVIKDVLMNEMNIKSPKFLKSEYLIVPISYYTHLKGGILSPSDLLKIKQWLILASFNRRYTGRLETDLADDINKLKEEMDFQKLQTNLSFTEATEEWLDNTYDREHLTALMIMLKDAYDMSAGAIRICGLNAENIHIHHIFPKALLAKYYVDGMVRDMDLETAYDHIANITIISSHANESIGGSNPYEYLNSLDSEILKAHMIPEDSELWKIEKYTEFLEQRKRLMLQKLKKLLGQK